MLEFATPADRLSFIAEHALTVLRDHLIAQDPEWADSISTWSELNLENQGEALEDVDAILRGMVPSYIITPASDDIFMTAVKAIGEVTCVKP